MTSTESQRTAANPSGAKVRSLTVSTLFAALSLPRLLIVLLLGVLLRLLLFQRAFIGLPSILALLFGVLSDLGLAIVLSPAPTLWGRRGSKAATALSAVPFAILFAVSTAEYFYFDEFGTRFDQVVLDYIFYTGEVTGNVFESYPVPLLVFLSIAFGALAAILVRRFSVGEKDAPSVRIPQRTLWLITGLILFALSALTQPPFRDRTTRELAGNGLCSLAGAAFTGELDYGSHYSTLPNPVARLRSLMEKEPGFLGFAGDGGVKRTIDTGHPEKRPDVVLVIAESFGRELTERGTPSGIPSLSPRMDAVFGEGLLFDRFYATGTRTARALEGALASFPPVPGNAIVRLRTQRPLTSIASVLRARGYTSAFVYGGSLKFDNMRSFLRAAGFDRAIEDAGKDAPGSFQTSWGAADEFVLERAVRELKEAKSSGKPAFIAVLTVSNHRPFLFPEGRVEGAQEKKRSGAARYADEALGRFFDALKAENLRQGTIVALIGDHGPRSYTRERMPADAHRVPFFLWGDAEFIRPGAILPTIGSTIDVAPTLLGVLGGTYEAAFFGRDLMRVPESQGWAPMQDKQDIGVRSEAGFTILGFNGNDRFVPLHPQTDAPQGKPLPSDSPSLPSGAFQRDDAIALFQSAAELYVSGAADAQKD